MKVVAEVGKSKLKRWNSKNGAVKSGIEMTCCEMFFFYKDRIIISVFVSFSKIYDYS